MAVPHVARQHKAVALAVMALLMTSWIVAAGNFGLTAQAGDIDQDGVPDVPLAAFEQPANVQPNPLGVDPDEGAEGVLKNLATDGVPTVALSAYRRAETLLGKADPACHLPWFLVAAIGRVESDHGRIDGGALSIKGVATPPIVGVALNGADGTTAVGDTDSGRLDGDTQFDHAVGPMQFIPSTWLAVAVDADSDSARDPQDIDDAATAAGVYLCSGTGDLSHAGDARAAVLRYNNSPAYADLVLAVADAYRSGEFVSTPSGGTSAEPKPSPSKSGSTGGNSGGSSGGPTGGSTTSPKPPPPTTQPPPAITRAQAEAICRSKYNPLFEGAHYQACLASYGF